MIHRAYIDTLHIAMSGILSFKKNDIISSIFHIPNLMKRRRKISRLFTFVEENSTNILKSSESYGISFDNFILYIIRNNFKKKIIFILSIPFFIKIYSELHVLLGPPYL